VIGEDFAGYIFKITGGHDKQGFPMRQGVLASGRVRLLLPVGMLCFLLRCAISFIGSFSLALVHFCRVSTPFFFFVIVLVSLLFFISRVLLYVCILTSTCMYGFEYLRVLL
jgi:hypothetical protein